MEYGVLTVLYRRDGIPLVGTELFLDVPIVRSTFDMKLEVFLNKLFVRAKPPMAPRSFPGL